MAARTRHVYSTTALSEILKCVGSLFLVQPCGETWLILETVDITGTIVKIHPAQTHALSRHQTQSQSVDEKFGFCVALLLVRFFWFLWPQSHICRSSFGGVHQIKCRREVPTVGLEPDRLGIRLGKIRVGSVALGRGFEQGHRFSDCIIHQK